MCKQKFPLLACRPVGAQTMAGGVIAMFEFENEPLAPRIVSERHYQLVLPDNVTDSDLCDYGQRLAE